MDKTVRVSDKERGLSELVVTTERFLAAGGDAIARAPDGRIVFVSGACPEEQVRVEIVRDNPTFLRARVVEVVKAGPARVEPRCVYFGVCGGCSLQHVSADAQLASKEAGVVDTLARIGGVKIALEPSWSGTAYGYRTRARIAVSERAIGYRKQDSREVVDVELCPILAPAVQSALTELRKKRPRLGEHELGGAGPGIFEQSNAEGNRAMVAHVEELARGSENVVELYAGSGNFTRVLPGKVHAIEANKAATRLSPLPIENAPVEQALARLQPGPDLLLLDPPRTGASKEAIEHLLRLHPEKIIYVSCDPATFARDIKKLSAAYRLERLRVFDLYPQTAHVEVIGRLTRAPT